MSNPDSLYIKKLPEHVYARLRAGEVIERPADVVRELTDNSIDAQATTITLSLVDGGKKVIQIEDDGTGMPEKDIRLSIGQYFTSKIRFFEDLSSLNTMGFRGEALHAISHVAGVLFIHSRHKTSQTERALEMEVNRGVEVAYSYPPRSHGTTIRVLDLFETMRPRREMLKRLSTELAHCQDVLVHKMLCRPGIHFKIIHNKREILNAPAVKNTHDRLTQLWPIDVVESLIPIKIHTDIDQRPVSIEGYIGKPKHTHSKKNWIFFYVNKRPVQIQLLTATALNSYRGMIISGAYPTIWLNIEIDPALIDINVHPTKKEIRFITAQKMAGILYWAIRNALLSDARQDFSPPHTEENKGNEALHNFTESLSAERAEGKAVSREDHEEAGHLNLQQKTPLPPLTYGLISEKSDPLQSTAYFHRSIESTNDHLQKSLIDDNKAIDSIAMSAIDNEKANDSTQDKQTHQTAPPNKAMQGLPYSDDSSTILGDATQGNHLKSVSKKLPEGYEILGVILGTYIVISCGRENCLLIDQHAAHERLNFEDLQEKVRNHGIPKQKLIEPMIFHTAPHEYAAIEEDVEKLENLGFSVRVGDNHQAWVIEVPTFVQSGQEIKTLRKILNRSFEEEPWPTPLDLVRDSLASQACRMSIKAHDEQSSEELAQLIHDLITKKHPLTCPHGRPISISLENKDLNKLFRRR